MAQYRLRLYVTGKTQQSRRATKNLRAICESDLGPSCEIEVIDVLEQPQLAEDENILATPTLVRTLPEPVHKIIGDLSDRAKVLQGLDLEHAEEGGRARARALGTDGSRSGSPNSAARAAER